MRAVANEYRQDPKPLRLSYFGPCYRYEEFKTGRYREFWQYGAELIGATGPIAEAEVLALAVSMLEASGLVDWEFKVGNVGVLRAVLAALEISDVVPEGATESAMASAMRFLDKGDNEGLEAMMEPSKSDILNKLSSLQGGVEVIDEARELLGTIDGIDLSALDDLAIMLNALSNLAPSPPKLSVNLTVARGLDYYTGMVFEAQVPELKGEGQVLGGGTYRLLHLFGLEELDPCCGFGLGFDRVLLALEKQAERLGRDEVLPDENSGPGVVAVIPFKVAVDEVLPLVSQMRAAGERAVLELRSRKLGKSMSWADSIGAEHVIIIGPEDLENGVCTIRRLSDGEQTTPAMDGVLEALQGLR
jgi:histidyl-tRNA synthetase